MKFHDSMHDQGAVEEGLVEALNALRDLTTL